MCRKNPCKCLNILIEETMNLSSTSPPAIVTVTVFGSPSPIRKLVWLVLERGQRQIGQIRLDSNWVSKSGALRTDRAREQCKTFPFVWNRTVSETCGHDEDRAKQESTNLKPSAFGQATATAKHANENRYSLHMVREMLNQSLNSIYLRAFTVQRTNRPFSI